MEASRIAQKESMTLQFETHKEVQEFLNLLHDYYDFSWPQIYELPAINPPGETPVPVSTLAKIGKDGTVPKKWRFRFGVGGIDNRQRISISKIDMQSAAETIWNNLKPDKRQELYKRLGERLNAQLPRR